MTDQPMSDRDLLEQEVMTNIKLRDSLEKAEAERDSFQETANFWCDRAQEAQAERDAALARAEKAEAEVERLRTQLDDLRIIQDGYPYTARGTDEIEEFMKATMDEKWTRHAAPSSIPWLTIGDWLCELRDYRKALGEARSDD